MGQNAELWATGWKWKIYGAARDHSLWIEASQLEDSLCEVIPRYFTRVCAVVVAAGDTGTHKAKNELR